MTSRFEQLVKPLTDSKLPNVYVKGALRFKQISCTAALVASEVNLGDADFVFFDENSTALLATLTIDDESGPALPIGPLRGFRDMPCKRIFLTCAAQSGKVLNLWYGKGVYLYGAQPAGKGQWYDRNPAIVGGRYNLSNVAPHAATDRWTYTVPTGKKAILESAMSQAVRQTAGGVAGFVTAGIYIDRGDGTLFDISPLFLMLNTANDRDSKQIGGAIFLSAGAIVHGYTSDTTTGGTVTYQLSGKLTEFDA